MAPSSSLPQIFRPPAETERQRGPAPHLGYLRVLDYVATLVPFGVVDRLLLACPQIPQAAWLVLG